MAAIQYTTLDEEPVRSAIVIPFPGVQARGVQARAAPAARLPESVYRRRRLVAASVVAAVLTVLLAVARPAEAPLEAVDPWSSQVTPVTEGGSVGEGV